MDKDIFGIINNPLKKSKNKVTNPNGKYVYIETYGCQMNLSDTEIVLSVLNDYGYQETEEIGKSDVILLNTCSVRDNAEKKIRNRLVHLRSLKKKNPGIVLGIIGCMAERLRDGIKSVDLIVGPDEYRKLPLLIESVLETGEKGIAVKLSKVETYDDIKPLRKDGVTAWISVMRGCDKFCTYCVVPFTRGRERSRYYESIINEAKNLDEQGFKEITLLGQNVNSYKFDDVGFPSLLAMIAEAVPNMRIRYTTSHPYDLSDELLKVMSDYDNICKYIHLPVQSGSDRILKLMNREYSIENYMKIIDKARKLMPTIAFSTDIISGFPTETEDDHKRTLELMKEVQYDGAFMFAYSPRENTKAFKMDDTVPQEIKLIRLSEIIEQQNGISSYRNRLLIGQRKTILCETYSKKSKDFLMGRTDCNRSVIIPKDDYNIGDFVEVKIEKANSATLFGSIIK